MRGFTVVIPLFNKANFIERCLTSLNKQTFKNFEIVIVDDGSTDDSVRIAEIFIDENTTLIRQKNSGVSIARNNGVKKASYEYVVFLDADDTWESDFLNELDQLIEQYPNAGIYGLNNIFKTKDGNSIIIDFKKILNNENRGFIKDYFDSFSKYGKSPFSNSSCCIPKDVFVKIGGYEPGVRLTEDSDLWCRIALQYKVAFSNRPLATYFLEVPNNTRSIFQNEDYQVSITLQKMVDNKSVPDCFIKSVNKLISFQQLSLIKRAILTGNKRFALKKLLDKRVIIRYPIQFLLHFTYAIIPLNILQKLKRIISK